MHTCCRLKAVTTLYVLRVNLIACWCAGRRQRQQPAKSECRGGECIDGGRRDDDDDDDDW